MILAHHLGEGLIPMLLAGGVTTGSVLLALVRARLSSLGTGFRRPGRR